MFPGKRKTEQLLNKMESNVERQSYWAIVRRQFAKNRLAVWSLRILYVIVFIALFGDFIANEKPFYCQIDGQTHYPIFKSYAVDWGWSTWEVQFLQKDWSDHDYETAWFPLIPYSPLTQDRKNSSFKSPFGPQEVASKRYWHWMGTDLLGRDILSGMIHGTRVAMMVGIIAMSVAAFLGILLGGFAGYFGDEQLRMSRGRMILLIPAFLFALFYAFMARSYWLMEGDFSVEIFKSMAWFLLVFLSFQLLSSLLKFIPFFRKQLAFPADILVMRLIEIFQSIPTLFILLAVLAIIESNSIFNVMLIIGLVSWTNIARFVRSELLRVRSLEFVEAGRALGFSEWRIVLRHAIPNALSPVLITIAFGIAGAILAEASISFLGIGIPVTEVTWGQLLNVARTNPQAWWLAVFPGLAIFITVTVFNLLGEGLTDALDPRSRT
ncbi:MAG: ABC transporter permease [Bacteroidota bacterium]